jgi:hypothetical protein
VRKRDLIFQMPCAECANAILFFQSLAQGAQMRFNFSNALRGVRKRVLISFYLCAACASPFYFENILARCAQACFIFDSPLRGVRKPVLESILTERGAEHL